MSASSISGAPPHLARMMLLAYCPDVITYGSSPPLRPYGTKV